MTFLHVFGIDPVDGAQPNGPLLQASDGNFYGTTRAGGAGRCFDVDNFCGVIFKVTPGGVESVVHRFGVAASDGRTPAGALIQGRDGALYGLTTSGGTYNFGTLFRITLSGSYNVLHSFGASKLVGDRPRGSLVEGRDGNFYGATVGGGPYDCSQSGGECGTVFRVSPEGEHKVLHSFGSSAEDGIGPNGALVEGADGNFYGTTAVGGDLSCVALFSNIKGCGTVYRMTPAGSVTVLHTFGRSSADGRLPQGPLTSGGDGTFYGTTYLGGSIGGCSSTNGCGTVFKITLTGAVTILYAFAKPRADGTPTPADGYNPGPVLLRARDGIFYGVTESVTLAGSANTGTVFRITPSGAKTTLYTFGALNEVPTEPIGGLVEGTDGAFYGLTADNGKLGSVGPRSGAGTVFKLTLP